MPPDNLDLLRGTFDLILLRTLAWGPMHGLGILRWIESTTQSGLQIEEGSLYPALHRLELKGWLAAEWGISENNRKAKYYRLTPLGRRQLATELKRWSRYTDLIALIIAANDPEKTATVGGVP